MKACSRPFEIEQYLRARRLDAECAFQVSVPGRPLPPKRNPGLTCDPVPRVATRHCAPM